MTNNETGYCAADITKKIEEYEKQLDSLDEQIAQDFLMYNEFATTFTKESDPVR